MTHGPPEVAAQLGAPLALMQRAGRDTGKRQALPGAVFGASSSSVEIIGFATRARAAVVR